MKLYENVKLILNDVHFHGNQLNANSKHQNFTMIKAKHTIGKVSQFLVIFLLIVLFVLCETSYFILHVIYILYITYILRVILMS